MLVLSFVVLGDLFVCTPEVYWTAVRSTVWAAVQAGVSHGCFGFGLQVLWLNLSPEAGHYCAVVQVPGLFYDPTIN